MTNLVMRWLAELGIHDTYVIQNEHLLLNKRYLHSSCHSFLTSFSFFIQTFVQHFLWILWKVKLQNTIEEWLKIISVYCLRNLSFPVNNCGRIIPQKFYRADQIPFFANKSSTLCFCDCCIKASSIFSDKTSFSASKMSRSLWCYWEKTSILC